MALNSILIGTLKKDGLLQVDGREILLTKISQRSDRFPESAVLRITTEQQGRFAIVRGELSGEILYSAEIVEVLPCLTGALFRTLIDKGIVSMEDVREHLKEIEPEVKEGLEKKKLCALVIGHKKSSPGAVNEKTGLTEFDFNEDLAIRIEEKVRSVDIQRVYRRTYQELPGDINALGPDFVVSLHCNAFNGRASGTEVLYYHKSEKGRLMAEILKRHLVETLGLPDRGIKAKTAEDRGGYLLRYTVAPCIISEPFFIDNDNDLKKAKEELDSLVTAYAEAIEEIADMIDLTRGL